MSELRLRSLDGRFGVLLPDALWAELCELCSLAAPSETGGILIGRYNSAHDCAIVTKVTGPPTDSKAGGSWFQRGVAGLQGLLNRLWAAQEVHYLGEWHFHPNSAPDPSPTDTDQLKEIRDSTEYSRPEPLLLIVGGGPAGPWQARALVFPRDSTPVELISQEGHVSRMKAERR